MKLSLHPNPGNGMTWELTLEAAGVEFSAYAGERIERSNSYGSDVINRDEAWAEAARIAAELGLDNLESDDEEHGTWTRGEAEPIRNLGGGQCKPDAHRCGLDAQTGMPACFGTWSR